MYLQSDFSSIIFHATKGHFALHLTTILSSKRFMKVMHCPSLKMIIFIVFWFDFVLSSSSISWNKGCLPKDSWKNENLGRFESLPLPDQEKEIVCSLVANRLSWVSFFLVEEDGMCGLSDLTILSSECEQVREQVPEQTRIVGYTKLQPNQGMKSKKTHFFNYFICSLYLFEWIRSSE